jgi:DNA-binding transcriptional LysR family regulator
MVSDIETLLLMIEAGMGVAILSRRMVEFYPSYQLKCIPIEDPSPGLDFIAIWPEKSNNPLVSLFIKTLPEG